MRRIVLLSALILLGVAVAAGTRALAESGSSRAAGPSVSITHFDAPVSGALGIVLGPDRAHWFTNGDNNSIGRITTTGKISSYRAASISNPGGIVLGPDGALWFTNNGNDTIGRITTGGRTSTYRDATISNPWGIVVGPDGALWFTNNGNDSIGRAQIVAHH